MVSELSDSSLANRYVTKSVHFVPQNYEEYGDFMETHMVEINGYFHMPWPIAGGFEFLVLREEIGNSVPAKGGLLLEQTEQEPAPRMVETLVSSINGSDVKLSCSMGGKSIDYVVEGVSTGEANLSRLLKSYSEISTYQVLVKSPEKEGLSYGLVKLFDPGIDTYFPKSVLDPCMLMGATSLEAPNLWENGVNLDYKEPFKESGVKGKSGIDLDFKFVLKDVALVMIGEYTYGVISKEIWVVSNLKRFEWIIAWALECDVYAMVYLGGNIIEWRIAWGSYSTKCEEEKANTLGTRCVKGEALL